MAIYRPRIFIIEAGNSFGLLGQYLQAHGVSLNQVTLAPNVDVSLPPFSEALKLLDQRSQTVGSSAHNENTDWLADELDNETVDGDEQDVDSEAGDDPDSEDTARDLLGEMEIASRIMITGGDSREDEPVSYTHLRAHETHH